MNPAKPLVTLETNGQPSVLNYNVPQPSSYTGRNLIELSYPARIFKVLKGAEATPPDFKPSNPRRLEQAQGWAQQRAALSASPVVQRQQSKVDAQKVSAAPTKAPAVEALLDAGRLPVLVPTMGGNVKTVYVEPPKRPNPGIYLVESYRLSNFLGNYGAGKTVKTFSLLPGEKTRISITTYRNSTETSTTTNSIFDSYTTETADEFESAIQSENSSTEGKDKTVEWHVEAEASGNWGVGSASVSGGASGSTNTTREDFAKNVSTASEKHAQTASAQRDISVNTTTSATTETGEQTAIEREIANINVGRTLNFVFRQLNQEFISILHLVDVRIGFFNGYLDKKMEVPLHEIDRFLEYCITTPEDRARVKADILFSLTNIYDYRNQPRNFLARREFREADGKKSVIEVINRDLNSVYADKGHNITVPGIILSAKSITLPTDAVIVESLLGEAEALDEYSRGLQNEKVREQVLLNQLRELEIAERQARLDILSAKDAAAAEIHVQLFTPPPTEV